MSTLYVTPPQSLLDALSTDVNDQILPRTNHRLRKLQTDIARKKPTFALREQVINEVPPSQYFLRANRIDAREAMCGREHGNPRGACHIWVTEVSL